MSQKERLLFLNKELGTSYESLEMIDWTYVSYHYKLSENFIREFSDKVNWPRISKFQKLSEGFMRDFNGELYWSSISKYQKLSEDFIREFKHKVSWPGISIYQKLSEDFIREFKDELYWSSISKHQKLSEDFIREFKDDVDWWMISKYQKLSEAFIREFQEMADWICISKYQKLSDEFILEFYNELSHGLIMNNWAYKDTEFLKRQVEATGLYECRDDYFIAYKGIRSDRYSKYNFQYQYIPGETYEAFCDCSDNANSFGLSVWTEENARKYSNELVVKVKVRYEDVGRVVHNGGKVRCRKITILD